MLYEVITGASGDLIHLAHLALAIIGEGQVFYGGELRSAAEVYRELGVTPMRLSFKEGIALMNGTSAMTALAAFALFGAQKLLNIACVTGAFSLEIFGGIDDAFDADLHRVKPHPGQVAVAETVRNLYRRITSYNVCYTKLLRFLCRHIPRACRAGVPRRRTATP